MATIKAHGSFVPFTMPLGVDDLVVISFDLLGLRINSWIGTLHLEQKMYNKEGEISQTILT
jgi:hypothetical protein